MGTKPSSARRDALKALTDFDPAETAYLLEGMRCRDEALSPYATHNADELRKRYVHYPRYKDDQSAYTIRPPFAMDVDKVLNNPFYNRATDKTQVFSLYRNDDITHRSYHLQLVSRIARTLGQALRLNIDLIEAIALGHDMGHTPFGHEGERLLSSIYHERTGRYFNHNVHSVRILKDLCDLNLTVQSYDGMLCHCGEAVSQEYRPHNLSSFEELEAVVEECYVDQSAIKRLRPSTLEGCVVRISDILAYVGKDRQDVRKLLGGDHDLAYRDGLLGTQNWEIIRNVTANIVKNSIGKDYLSMDPEVERALSELKDENYQLIYKPTDTEERATFFNELIGPMMRRIYERFADDIEHGRTDSPVYTRHLALHPVSRFYAQGTSTVDDMVVDSIAAMTDDYFIALYLHLFPDDPLNSEVKYHSYFEDGL